MKTLLTLGWLCTVAAGARGATVGNEIFQGGVEGDLPPSDRSVDVDVGDSGAFRCADEEDTVGNEIILLARGTGGGTQATPHVAFGKGVYLVVWREGWHGKGGSARIYAPRVDTEGKLLDARGIAVAPSKQGVQTRPRVAFGGGCFLVVWQDLRTGMDHEVLGAGIGADGTVLDAEPIQVAAGPRTQALPDLASDGRAFVIVWQGLQAAETHYRGFARRVGADGRAGPAVTSRASPQPKIAWGGKHYLVAYGTQTLDSLRLTSDGTPADAGRKPWDGRVVRGSKHLLAGRAAEARVADRQSPLAAGPLGLGRPGRHPLLSDDTRRPARPVARAARQAGPRRQLVQARQLARRGPHAGPGQARRRCGARDR